MYNIEDIKNKIIQGDALSELKKIPSESIDLIITSPPYYGLRDYRVEGQIGLEDTFEEYLKKILDITAEIKRVLKKSGSFWLNLGDIYGSHTFGNSKSAGGIQKKLCQEAEGFPRYSNKAKSLGDKCLGMMPERIALAMIDQQGWILRNKIKWAKQVLIKKENRTMGSVMPTSVKDRFNESGEELYFFVKSKKYYSDLDVVRLSPQTFENRPDGITRSREYGYDSKYFNNYSPQNKQLNVRFNYRVRDAKRKEGQPQFRASEEEIKRYNEVPENYGKKKLQNLPDKGKGLNRWMSGTPNYVYQGKFAGRKDVEMFNSPRARTQRNKTIQDPNAKGLRQAPEPGEPNAFNIKGKNLPTIWQINPEPHNFKKELNLDIEHFAIFPKALIEIPIKFGCPKGGIVLDPFMGSGTTAVAAKQLKRNFIGIEISEKYCEVARRRLGQEVIPI